MEGKLAPSINTIRSREAKSLVALEWKSERIKTIVMSSSSIGDVPRRRRVVEFVRINSAVFDWSLDNVNITLNRDGTLSSRRT